MIDAKSWRTAPLGGLVLAVVALASTVACDKRSPAPGAPEPTPRVAIAPVEASAASASGAPSASAAPAPALPADANVLVLSIDSLRADMPWAGYPRPIAPRLTELEKRAVSYTRGYAISSYTSMSLGGFLGGKLPSGMKRSGYFFGKYAPENVMFPELLAKADVRTVAAHAHSYFKEAGFDQGFDAWEIVSGIVFKNETDPNVTSPQHEALAEKLLDGVGNDGRRFFAWFHFLDPHDQYLPHDKDGVPPYGKTLRDRYDAEVTFTDRYVGKLLDYVEQKPWAKRTVIVVTADHGEGFGEHGRFSHGFDLWENLVRVPLFFVIPGVAPRRIDTPRSGIDLAPTICEILGVPRSATAEAGFEGVSLVPELLGGEAEARDVILDLPMTSDNDKKRALVRGTKKLLATGVNESLVLYDLAEDPTEDRPIRSGEVFTEMAAAYRDRSKAIVEVPPFACGANCLNRAYAKAKPGAAKGE